MVKSLPAMQETWFHPRVGKIPWRRKWQPTPVFLPGEIHGQRSLAGYSPWDHKESDTTERLTHTHTPVVIRINFGIISVQFSSVQLLSRVRLFATPWIAARQASLSITNSRSSLRLTYIESLMPSSHLILCRPLLLLPPIPLSIRVFSNESANLPPYNSKEMVLRDLSQVVR